MDYVNLQVAIGVDVGNTVPNFFVPVSEVAILAAIHGPDSLTEIEVVDAPDGVDELTSREEIERLASIYGRVTDSEGVSILRQVYPGAGAKVMTDVSDLDIPEGAMKVTERATIKKAPASKKADKKADAKDDVMG